jgi:hypothetical protein
MTAHSSSPPQLGMDQYIRICPKSGKPLYKICVCYRPRSNRKTQPWCWLALRRHSKHLSLKDRETYIKDSGWASCTLKISTLLHQLLNPEYTTLLTTWIQYIHFSYWKTYLDHHLHHEWQRLAVIPPTSFLSGDNGDLSILMRDIL